MSRNSNSKFAALSLMELLILVAVIGVLATIGVSTMGIGVLSGTQSVKREQDIRVLNSAVSAYMASGGDLSGVTDPGQVLAKLKTRVSAEQQRRIPGLAGNFLDTEVELVMQTEEEARTDDPRIRWNSGTSHFEISYTGDPGIKMLNTQSRPTGAGEVEVVSEDRSAGLKYSAEGTWIWDYQDVAPTIAAGPSTFTTGSTPDSTPSTPTGPPTSPMPVPKKSLQPPLFSIPGGRYPGYEFTMALTLSDPNPAGASQIYYSVNYGTWVLYATGTPISVTPDSSIKAQAMPVNKAIWDPSAPIDERYYSYQVKLIPPNVDFSKPYFTTGKTQSVDTITVSLSDPNDPGTSAILYQLVPVPGGSGPITEFKSYSGSFTVSSTAYPKGFGVRAFASALKVGYDDSRVNSRFATAQAGLFGGHLDLDTSVTIAAVGNGSTAAHTHDITGKYGTSTIDFFQIPDSKQIEVTEAITKPSQKFKIIVVNANLSPGMSLVMDYDASGTPRKVDTPVNEYDNTPTKDLPVFSLGGTGSSAKLKRLQVVMSQDVIHTAGIIPTVTGDVRSNVLGKKNEWRNGSLTLQAVAVNDDGSEAFSVSGNRSNGEHGAAVSGLLWEAALFWHWGGDSYDRAGNTYVPGQYDTVSSEVDD